MFGIRYFCPWQMKLGRNFTSGSKDLGGSSVFGKQESEFLKGVKQMCCRDRQKCQVPIRARNRTTANPTAKSCLTPMGARGRHIFVTCGTNLNLMGSELPIDPEPLGFEITYSGKTLLPSTKEK